MVPALGGNWVDLSVLLVLFFYILGGFGRGFILGIFDLGGFLLSFVAALKWYGVFGSVFVANFSLPAGISNAIGFFMVGFVVQTGISYLSVFLYRRVYVQLIGAIGNKNQEKMIRLIDKSLGVLPAIGEAVIFTAFILTLVVTLPIQGRIKKDIVSSKLGGPLVAKTQGIERELNSVFGSAVNETLTFITVNPNATSPDRISLHFTQTDVKTDELSENTMLDLINQERTKAGLKQLTFSKALQKLAREYATDMFKRGYFSHYNPEGKSPFDRMDEARISYLAAGENLALAPNVTLAHQGLMNSPGHRANILSPDYGKVGIGVIDGGMYGEMFVQEFTD